MMKLSALALTTAICIALTGTAKAGPVEQFSGAFQESGKPSQIVAPYVWGGGGLFVSADAGKTFGLVCSASSGDANLITQNTDRIVYLSGAGATYIGLFGGMWKGDENGCGLKQVPELRGHVLGDIQGDPIDPKRTYVATADGADAMGNPKNNGLLMNDGTSDAFVLFGKQEPTWVKSIDVVKNGTGRRIYETGATSMQVTDPTTGMPTDNVHYYVRMSDDDGVTFTQSEYDLTQFGPIDVHGLFKVMAVDPANPDQVYAVVTRDMAPDTVLYNPLQGKAGAWQMVTEVGDLEAMEFTPDGKLYFGDYDQASPALFVIDKPGAAPRMLNNQWKVGCLHYDAMGQRMLACRDWQFGTADLTSGEFNVLYDMRCADHFVSCPDQDSMHTACEVQLEAAFCGGSHYPAAPVCVGYDQGDGATAYIDSSDYTCIGPTVTPKPAGAMTNAPGGVAMTPVAGSTGLAGAGVGTAGSSAGAMSVAGAGGIMIAPNAAPPVPSSRGGCSVSQLASDDAATRVGVVLLVVVPMMLRRRRRAA
jgi:hypothetical protein